MKTDRVLTIEECLNEWGEALTRVDSPACDARHGPITQEKDADPRDEHSQLQLRSLGSSVSKLCRAQNPTAVGAFDFVPAKQLHNAIVILRNPGPKN